jgi:predicted GNAT family acetyltransferase
VASFRTASGYLCEVSAHFTHEETDHLFVAEVDGHQATLSYRPVDETVLDFQSTYVPHVLRNRNVGTQLVRYALDFAREKGLQVIPSCWFVGSVVERHPEYRDLLKR